MKEEKKQKTSDCSEWKPLYVAKLFVLTREKPLKRETSPNSKKRNGGGKRDE